MAKSRRTTGVNRRREQGVETPNGAAAASMENSKAANDACTSDTSLDGEDSDGATAAAEASMDNTASPPLPSQPMDPRLLKAATSGDSESLHGMASQHPEVLQGTTPAGNTCLHIASAHGYLEFCKQILELDQSLRTAVNADNETPLVIAVKNGHASVAWVLLAFCRGHQQLRDAVLQKDKNGCNALHHAVRGGHAKLALELIATEAGLSRDANNNKESPMFIAAVKNLTRVIEKLLENSDSAHGGPCSQNALHAAVRKGNPDAARLIMKTRPQLAREENADKSSPMHQAIHDKKIDIVTVLLENDPSLGYLLCSKSDAPPLSSAAAVGDVGIARELLKHCPDTPYNDKSGSTCLHEAVSNGHTGFVEFLLRSKQLPPLINMQDHEGRTALHIAAEKRNSRMISALISHQGIDITLPNNSGKTARQVLPAATEDKKETIWIPDGAATIVSPSTGSVPMMDGRLLEAATSGDTSPMVMQQALRDPDMLLATTPHGNTCLHISSAHGHLEFCKQILELNQNQSLLTAVNASNETPLVIAVKNGHASLASVLLAFCRGHQQLRDAVLQKDQNGCNALHHAIRGGHRGLALELIATEPGLSRDVNKEESPMFIAAVKNFADVVGKLLAISDSSHGGPSGQNALHAAVGKGNPDIVRSIMEARPWLAREENGDKYSPMGKAVYENKIDIVAVLLQHDRSLGYLLISNSDPLLSVAAASGHVGVARELLKHCPDAPYCNKTGWSCLHAAAWNGRTGFAQFVLDSKQLHQVINMQEKYGRTALHIAAEKRNSRLISALLAHQGIDITLLNYKGKTAKQVLAAATKDNKDSIWIPDGAVTAVLPSARAEMTMDGRLLEAATSGDTSSIVMQLGLADPGVLLATTPQGNTCLHIASAPGHQEFCKHILELNLSLLTAVNADNETPLVVAVKSGHASLASVFLALCRGHQQLSDASVLLQKDKNGCHALHHAIRSGHEKLALDLIAAEPALSRDVNNNEESPMFIAAVKSFTAVVGKLLEISDSAHGGPGGQNTLHAAVGKGNLGIVRKIMETRPSLAREEDGNKFSPMTKAISHDKIDILNVLLEHDPSLGYLINSSSVPPLSSAAIAGHVGIARELLKRCPDTPYYDKSGSTCLHEAVSNGHTGFVEFLLRSKQLPPLINMQDHEGRTALHIAAEKRNSRMISALVFHKGIDITLPNNSGQTARQVLPATTEDNEDDKQCISIPDGEAAPVWLGAVLMDRRLLDAATSGDTSSIPMEPSLPDPPAGVLLATTPQGNTCLHIASAHGHLEFCKHVLERNQSLLQTVNVDGETPLLTAVTSGQVPVASFFLSYCREHHLSSVIIKQDKNGCNVLHHAIRSGHRKLAIDFIEAEPVLSRAVNKDDESPMFIAVMRDIPDVLKKLLEVPDSAHGGASGYNALHAAVRNGNQDIAQMLVRERPELAREETSTMMTPTQFAALENKIGVLSVLLQHDYTLGFLVSTRGEPLLNTAADRGHVGVAKELLERCPDAPYGETCDHARTCLHRAVDNGQTEFVEFVVRSKHLRKLINMRDNDGDTALHYAIRKCNPKIVAALLRHQDIDLTILNNKGSPPVWLSSGGVDHAKTLNWNEICLLMLKADPKDEGEIRNIYKVIKDELTEKSRSDIRSLTQTYTSNTSLIAILIATITFAAAFTLPGGYSSDSGSEGLPIMARKLAFQVFLISNTLAMCSSLCVAFICIIARWEDLEFLVYYRYLTKRIMWFAYMATTTAFATGLYTVVAPRVPWLAIFICAVSFSLPILTKVVGEWPILRFKLLIGKTYRSEIIDDIV